MEKTVKIVNDLINARGVYLILRVQGGGGGAFNRKKAFKRAVTSSTKLICFGENIKKARKV